jgi:hypothetical protein
MPHFNIFRSNKYQYVSEQEFKEKLDMQRFLNSQVLQVFKKKGGASEKQLQVEFFFYTNEEDKASNLAIELNRLGYEVKSIDRQVIDGKWSITGRTQPMKMTTRTITKMVKANGCPRL